MDWLVSKISRGWSQEIFLKIEHRAVFQARPLENDTEVAFPTDGA